MGTRDDEREGEPAEKLVPCVKLCQFGTEEIDQ